MQGTTRQTPMFPATKMHITALLPAAFLQRKGDLNLNSYKQGLV